jgi:hypothetical protein
MDRASAIRNNVLRRRRAGRLREGVPLNLLPGETVQADFVEKQFTYAAMDHMKCGGTIGLGIHPLVLKGFTRNTEAR